MREVFDNEMMIIVDISLESTIPVYLLATIEGFRLVCQ